jgi:predicted DCC family thiol-disulfide oxidoreductase YuxK
MTQSLPPKVGQSDQVVLFDGQCKLCTGWSRFLIRYDKRRKFKLCSVQSEEGQAILAWFDLPTDDFTTMLLVQGDKALTKNDAFIVVIGQLPFPWKVVLVIRVIPKKIRNWIYDRLASRRYTIFGKHDRCVLPTPDDDRFL